MILLSLMALEAARYVFWYMDAAIFSFLVSFHFSHV